MWSHRNANTIKSLKLSEQCDQLYLFSTHAVICCNELTFKNPSSIRCQDINSRPHNHESPSITTGPGFPRSSLSREHSPKGEVSLHCWPPYYFVCIQHVYLYFINNNFTCLVNSKPVKQEVSRTVILLPLWWVFSALSYGLYLNDQTDLVESSNDVCRHFVICRFDVNKNDGQHFFGFDQKSWRKFES